MSKWDTHIKFVYILINVACCSFTIVNVLFFITYTRDIGLRFTTEPNPIYLIFTPYSAGIDFRRHEVIMACEAETFNQDIYDNFKLKKNFGLLALEKKYSSGVRVITNTIVLHGPVFSYKLRYIVGFWLVEMAISTNQKPTIYRNLYKNTGPANLKLNITWKSCTTIKQTDNTHYLWKHMF